MKINILSLFDGMSVAQQALKECGIEVENYFASEIDKYSIATTQANFPNTIQLGDVKEVGNVWKKIWNETKYRFTYRWLTLSRFINSWKKSWAKW